jgi:hypothetical protein
MNIEAISTIRSFHDTPSYQILYELEDDLCKYLNIPLQHKKRWQNELYKLVYKLPIHHPIPFSIHKKMDWYVMMNPDFHRHCLHKSHTIPCIVDFWEKNNIDEFVKNFSDFPFVYFYSLEAINFLKNKGVTLDLRHFPMSISDKWYDQYFEKEVSKDIDILQIGRKNLLLESFIQEYIKKYPETNYVQRKLIDGKNIYYSTLHGEIGTLDTREDYFNILSRSKISIVSMPGLDGDQKTGSIHPLTPRSLESMVTKCHLIGRFVENEEYLTFGLKDAVYNISTYSEFEKYARLCIHEPFEKTEIYKNLLLKNLNSVRAEQIKRDFQ